MAGPAVTVKVSGMDETRSALAKLGPTSERIIRTRMLQVAGGIAATLRGMLPSFSGAASGSVTAGMDRTGAWISEGAGVPYMPWLDFGGSTGRGHQRGPGMGAIHRDWLGRGVGEGRYIYPAIRQNMPITLKALDAAIAEAAGELGFDTSGDGTHA